MESDPSFNKVIIPLLSPLGYQTLKTVQSIQEIGFVKEEGDIHFLSAINVFENYRVIVKDKLKDLPIKTGKTKVIIKTRKIDSNNLNYSIIREGSVYRRDKLISLLLNQGYERVDYVEKQNEFSVRGGIFDIFPETEEHPVRLEFFSDEIISIRIFREDTQKTIRKADSLLLPGGTYTPHIQEIVMENIKEEGITPLPPFYRDFNELITAINHLTIQSYRVFFYTVEKERGKKYREILPCEVKTGLIEEGFVDSKNKIAVFTELMLFPIYKKKRKVQHTRTEIKRTFQKGEYVVHLDYGIARFDGLIRCKAFGREYDCVRLLFKDGVLDVPTYNLYLIERFNVDKPIINLSSLSQETWRKRKLKIQLKAYKLARDILEIHAKRKKISKKPYKPTPEIEERIALDFPYIETEDQKRAIDDVLNDLSQDTLMDRLIAGDVGFGKTEVAIRACARVVANSKQVLLLVPTTPLALQHYNLFRERLQKYGINVRMASRFVKKSELSKIENEVGTGKCDILISTHYVLRRNIVFKRLGLLVIDEEHKFGVKDKEILRQKYPDVDTLRLTATPIPRTLNMSLGKIYDLSVIETPPVGREEVETYVGPIDDKVIKNAISFEIARGGKVFYIHNRIHDLPMIERRIRRLLPHVKLKVAHGRVPPTKLEKILLEFYTGETEVLLSTAIMEAGVDFPKANTIIIENAHLFGLADLHQLRGRVGRGQVKGYAYFLIPSKLSHKALKRLDTIRRYHHLGAGFQIALKDMEIRGAGNILGREQHGFIETIGPSMFFKLLEMAISELEGKKRKEIELHFNAPAFIPEHYIQDDTTRVGFYTQIAEAKDIEELESLKAELKDRFGKLPAELSTFIYGMHLKILFAENTDVKKITVNTKNIRILDKNSNEITLRRLSPTDTLNLFMEIQEKSE